MKIFDAQYLSDLTGQARLSPRHRQHNNIHQSYQDVCQRLFNSIEPGSYIRPHRHASDPKDELLVAVRGVMALFTFDDKGDVINVMRFGTERYGEDMAIAAEVPSSSWHTVVALEPGCVLLEVKAGPFDPNQPKDLATWAPEEGTILAHDYLNRLLEIVNQPNVAE
jgi:cupin fold WbuC family metalloprotein